MDVSRDFRTINMESLLSDELLQQLSSGQLPSCVTNKSFQLDSENAEKLKSAIVSLRKLWPNVRNSLLSSLTSEETADAKSGRSFVCYATRFCGRRVRMGRPYSNDPILDYSLYEHVVSGDAVADTSPEVARAKHSIGFVELKEVISKLADLSLSDPVSDEGWRLVADLFGLPSHSPPCVEFLDALVCDDNMVDSYEMARPYTQGRFTCWNQQENKRYYNEGTTHSTALYQLTVLSPRHFLGTRIDAIYVDRSLWDMAGQKGAELAGYGPVGPQACLSLDNQTEYYAALAACTAEGAFKQAPCKKYFRLQKSC